MRHSFYLRDYYWNHRSILNNAIEDYNLRFISSGVIDFICTSLIALILTIKLFLIINQFEKHRSIKVEM